MSAAEPYRVGIDLIEVSQVADSMVRFGDRYLNRVFTPHELACARRGTRFDPSSLAARFAAKEATIKVLRPTGAQPDWRSIELRRLPSGSCEIALTSSAAVMAEAEGITSMAVSVTHEASMAASVVVAQCGPGPRAVDVPDRIQEGNVTEMERNDLEAAIRNILRDEGRLMIDPAELGDRDDLFEAGMTSHASVNVMLALEEEFDIEFPEVMLRKQTFESVFMLADALGTLIDSGVAC
jgi:phosphopantetheine--protein transferase-like protein